MLRIDPRIHASALRRAAREGPSLNAAPPSLPRGWLEDSL